MDTILIMIVVGIIIMAVALFLNAFVVVPPYHFDVLSVLGARKRGTKGVLREGWHIVWPLFTSRERIALELVKKDIKFTLTTKDGFKISVEGVFQYRPDPDVVHKKGHPDHLRNVFVSVSEEVIIAGVVEAVEARFGGIGGNHPHTVFIESRPALGDIINGILRMASPPHIVHQAKAGAPDPEGVENWESPSWRWCGHTNCEFNGPVNVTELIEFYKFHWPEIKVIKANERLLYNSRSEIELRYGIDVETFDLGNVDFTVETQTALEEKKQAVARAKAAKARLKIARKYRDEVGVSPQTAVDEADLLMDPAVKKTVVSVQGEAGILGGVLGSLAAKKDGE